MAEKPAPADRPNPPASGAVRRPRLPPLKSLIAFEAAARCGSFTQGAEEIALTTSAVSHHIQQLEEFLGVPLFQRHGGRAVLTPPGRTYAQEVERAFAAIANATELIAPQSWSGQLTIAVPNSFSVKWLQPRLENFLRSHPDLSIRLATLHTHELDAHRFDIGIAHGHPSNISMPAEPLLTERLRPLCSPQLARELRLEHPADLARATLIHSNNPLTWAEYFRRVHGSVVKPVHDLWLDRSAMAIEAAVKGIGVVLEGESLAEEELRDGRLVAPFREPCFQVEIATFYLVRSLSRRNAAEASAFETWLRAEIEQTSMRRQAPDR